MRGKSRKGITIIEACIAVAVLGIVISGVLGGLYLATHIGATTRNRTRAIQIIKGRMEELMASSYGSLQDSVENGYLYDNPERVPYTLTVSVGREYKGTKETGKVITVRIDWVQQNRNCYEDLTTFRRK